jgi:arylsulfatase A-like enzyme
MKSVDDMIGKIVATLKATGELSDTYFVFSSDNGLHMGDHRLMPGKLTAFETDIHVPLIMVGPGVRKGHRATSFAQNIDLRSTFDAFALTKPAEVVDGRSLVPLLSATSRTNGPPKGWPQGALIEHLGPVDNRQDPDYQNEQNANPPSYEALRLPGALYVEYSYGFREYYNLTDDPYELDNVYGSLSSQQRTALHDELVKAERCHNPKACAAPFETSS